MFINNLKQKNQNLNGQLEPDFQPVFAQIFKNQSKQWEPVINHMYTPQNLKNCVIDCSYTSV